MFMIDFLAIKTTLRCYCSIKQLVSSFITPAPKAIACNLGEKIKEKGEKRHEGAKKMGEAVQWGMDWCDAGLHGNKG